MKTMEIGKNSGIQSTIMGLGCMGMSEFYGDPDDVQAMADIGGRIRRQGVEKIVIKKA